MGYWHSDSLLDDSCSKMEDASETSGAKLRILYGGDLRLSSRMNQTEIQPQRPQRADARVNHDKLVAAARALFADKSTSAPLEEVAERAEVGIGTLYRHFPTRQALLEAVYVDEVEAMARAADDQSAESHALPFTGYIANKRGHFSIVLQMKFDADLIFAAASAS